MQRLARPRLSVDTAANIRPQVERRRDVGEEVEDVEEVGGVLWHRRSAANGATALVRGEHTSEAVTAHRMLPVATRKDASESTCLAHHPR